MIARTWQGQTRAGDAEEFAGYLRRTGLSEYRATPGNRGAHLLYRIDGDRAHFLALSFWENEDAIRLFAGDDVEKAVFYPEADHYLVARDERARHWIVEGGDERENKES